ncbi:MAG: alpha-amylase family glycosyl hydrolase [Acidimicrobiia bacterium]
MSAWWQRGVIYQIYPRSFQDTNGDGVGDLTGITRRLGCLEWLGIDAIWLCPIYRSPMADFGYDIVDHLDVDPVFGSRQDFDRLLKEAHRRGMRVILDYVPNHTSDQHPWFLESRSSRESSKRDWYIWADPSPGGGPPNNWWNHFDGGPAWTFDGVTAQYYLHLFLPQQPDLNWRNAEVEAAMLEVLRSWLEQGIDGFRVDVPAHLIKDPFLRDEPTDFDGEPGHPEVRTHNLPGVHEIIRRMRRVIDEYPGRLLIGETYLSLEELVRYYGRGDQFHLPHNFHLLSTPWEAAQVREIVECYEALLPYGAWPNWVLGNHDRPRVATRLGGSQARVAMMALLTLRGTPTIYYGDELGMTDGLVPPERMQDPQGRAFPGRGRDPARTPMQWDEEPHAGFCREGVAPWLPMGPHHRERNVAVEERDPRSMLRLTRSLLELRRKEEELQTGSYASLDAPDGVFAYRRGERWAVALNFMDRAAVWRAPSAGRVVLSTHLDREERLSAKVTLRPDEGLLLRLERHRRAPA